MKDFIQYLKKNPKKHIIFDLDETLYWLHIDRNIYAKKMLEVMNDLDHGIVKTYSTKENIFKVIFDIIRGMTEKYGEKAQKLSCQINQEVELPNLKGFGINTELINFIKNNYSDYKFYIWSSNMLDTIKHVLQKTHMEKYFNKIISKDKVMFMKGNPEGFYQIYDPKYKKSDYLMIGDSINDQLAAQNAGIDFLKVENVEWKDFT